MARVIGKKSKVRTIIYNHILNNKREYLIISILFFVGLIMSIILFNNLSEKNLISISEYLNNLFDNIKNYENIDLFKIFKKAIKYNFIIVVLLWFGASTIIGAPILYGTITLKGFLMGYTICSILSVLDLWNGLLISISLLLLHNIIFIPVMFGVSVSGLKLYKVIMKNKSREDIKLEILRHTIFCFIMLIVMVSSAFVESYVSTSISINLLKNIKF